MKANIPRIDGGSMKRAQRFDAAITLPRDPAEFEAVLRDVLGARIRRLTHALGEFTIVVRAADYVETCTMLRDDARLHFEQALDLCGVDYLDYGDGAHEGPRFATVLHLLSIEFNQRLRVRAFSTDDDFPSLPSVTQVWPSLNWFERESFDLYGIVYEGHPDLRRILTDYGFVGHPFRKDFPVSGYAEMRYDEDQKRVIYQPVTIEPRNNVPRVIREDGYGADRRVVNPPPPPPPPPAAAAPTAAAAKPESK